jgi:DNA-binding transcriptional ArsR family regulator
MHDEAILPFHVHAEAMHRVALRGVLTVRDLTDRLSLSPRFVDRLERERLERSVRHHLNLLAEQGVLIRRERCGRNGAHEYVPALERADR